MKTPVLKILVYLVIGIAMLVVLGARLASAFKPTSNTADNFYDRMSIPDSISIASKYILTDTCNNDSINRVDIIYFLSRDRMGIGGYYPKGEKKYFQETILFELKFKDGMVLYYKKPIHGKPLPFGLLECHYEFNTPLRYIVTDTLVNERLHRLLLLPGSYPAPGLIL